MCRKKRSEQIRRLTSMRTWLLVGAALVLVALGGGLVLTFPQHLQGKPVLQSTPTPNPLCNQPAVDEEVIYKVSDGGMSLYNPGVTPPAFARGLPTGGVVDAFVTFNETTPIFQQEGTICRILRRVSYHELKAGQRVKVWSLSGVAEASYPGQIPDTSAIVILP